MELILCTQWRITHCLDATFNFHGWKKVSPEAVIAQTPIANIIAENDGTYVWAWFDYNDTSLTVIEKEMLAT